MPFIRPRDDAHIVPCIFLYGSIFKRRTDLRFLFDFTSWFV